MNKALHLILIVFVCLIAGNLSAQSLRFSTRIIATDTITDEGVTFPASTDDAEQENDEIDSLTDDDIDAGWEGEPEDQNILTASMRFQNIWIPAGATIDSAYIIVYSHESKTTEDVANLTIVCDANPNAPTFTEDSLFTDRNRTNASIDWIVDEEWGLWTPHSTPDLSTLVQEVIDTDGWEAGNALAFIILGENQGPSEVENAREWESFENIADPEDGGDGQNHPERVPELVVFYSVQSAVVDQRIIATDTITDEGVTFPASSDDAEQENDEIDSLTDDDIDAGWEGEPDDQNILTAGMRFQNIWIPQGAVIDSAFIEVVSHESKTTEDVANLTIVCDANPNAPTFTEDSLFTDRNRTNASVEWIVDEEWGLWTPHRTPDLSALVQEVIDTDGWEAGNALAFIILGEDQGPSEVENAREWESFENIADPEDGGDGQNHPERVPRLLVYYSSDMATSVFDVFQPSVEELTIYPNPAQHLLTIELESDEAAMINIFNLSGQLIRGVRTDYGRQLQLNIGDLNTGMYLIQARQGEKVYAQKLIVE